MNIGLEIRRSLAEARALLDQDVKVMSSFQEDLCQTERLARRVEMSLLSSVLASAEHRVSEHELSPIVLREHGLVAGITWLAEYMRPRGLQVHVTVPSSDQVWLPEDQAVLLFQCVRELLLKIVKHAGGGSSGGLECVTRRHGPSD